MPQQQEYIVRLSKTNKWKKPSNWLHKTYWLNPNYFSIFSLFQALQGYRTSTNLKNSLFSEKPMTTDLTVSFQGPEDLSDPGQHLQDIPQDTSSPSPQPTAARAEKP